MISLHSHTGLRIEWCKARARAMRWSEEVELLQEEMRRVLRFHAFQAESWERKVESRPDSMSNVQWEGLRSYANRQANVQRSLYSRFAHMWRYVPEYIRTGNEALMDLLDDSNDRGDEFDNDIDNVSRIHFILHTTHCAQETT